ncbi:MAG: DUF1684 domain-containing protein [Dehalococcoidia bacterium]|nr:DUF1684 domain-containing protein [Dehalococcoidia bacterium]
MEISEWKAAIEKERKIKDRFFRSRYPGSPIPFDDRTRFKGLDYFPPDPAYRFELELHEHEEKRLAKIAYTKGREQDFLRWGEFRFKVGDKEQAIQAYKSDPAEERLFLLFRDKTSGRETYSAGRYLDLDPNKDQTPEGKWILDFNRAYNPWCGYSENYTCPLVPSENRLEVPIYAGERNYPLKEK